MVKSLLIRRKKPKRRYLRINQVLDIIPIGKSTWWKWVAEGKAPAGIKLGPKTTVWDSRDIRRLMNRFEDANDGKA